MSTFHASLVAAALLGQTVPPAADRTADDSSPDAQASARALEEFRRDAETYQITRGADTPTPLQLVRQPLLRWSNPARNGEHGVVYVWQKDGRPEVVGNVFTLVSRQTGRIRRKHTFHSLSAEPLTARFGGLLVWSPTQAGLSFAPVPGADPPADTPQRRLTQMRALARQFSMEMVDLQGEKYQLRLLAQPLWRYEPTAGPATDGAIFAFAEGTDPEALLLLEARHASDTLRWEYAFARSHFVQLQARHRNQSVWEVKADRDILGTIFGNDPFQRAKIYYSVYKP